MTASVLLLLLVAAAVLPALLLVWFFHARDTFPEPPRVIWTTFGLGCASIIPAVVLGFTIEPVMWSHDGLSVAAFQAFVVAALCEEASKLAVLLGYSFRHSAFDEPMDGIVYGAIASLGFATLENVLYVVDGGLGLAVVRGVLSVPGHAVYGAVMGYYVGRARFDAGARLRLIAMGLLAAVVLHGCYDFPLMALGESGKEGAATGATAITKVPDETLAVLFLIGLTTVVGGWIWALRLVRRVHTEQGVVLAAMQAAAAASTAAALPAPALTMVGAASQSIPDEGVPGPPPLPSPLPLHASATPWPAGVGAPVTPAVLQAEPAHVRPWRVFASWAAVIAGGLVASAGGLLIAIAIGFSVAGEVAPNDRLPLLVGIAIIGGLPAVAGTVAFVLGVRGLNRLKRGGGSRA